MDDDLSKWRTNSWVRYKDMTEATVTSKVWVGGCITGDSITVGMSLVDYTHDESLEVVVGEMSLDDAENFATLILYEVKRAKGEL